MKFSELNLHPGVMAGVEAQSYTECTPIQSASIPLILDGKDVAGLAQTGTGKTAAYVIPIIDRILRSQESKSNSVDTEDAPEAEAPAETDEYKVRVFKDWKPSNFILILVPTRELAEQVREQVKIIGGPSEMTSAAVYGGMSYKPQKSAINRGVNFIIATPGRLIDLYKEHIVDLNQVRAVIFDEADRMFDMGFKDDMKYLLKRIPKDRQFLVFSATLNFDVLNVAYEFGSHPVEVNVSRDQAKADNVEDLLFHVGTQDKGQFLLSLLKKHQPRQGIIFSNFKSNVERIAQFLSSNGIPAMGISSLLTQAQRNRVMDQFKKEGNDRNILVATDVAARGLDIKGVDIVVNFELPDDPENYVHRIGRTGRAGEKGLAMSLASERDVDALSRIEAFVGHKIEIGWLDDADLVADFEAFPQERREFRKSGGRDGHSKGGRDKGGRGGPRDGRRRDGERKGRDGDRKGRDDQRRNRDGDRKGRDDQRRNRDGDRKGRDDQRRNRDGDRKGKSGNKHHQDRNRETRDNENENSNQGSGQHRDRVTGRHRGQQDKQQQQHDAKSAGGGGGNRNKRKGKGGNKRYKKVYKHKPKDQRFDPTKKRGDSSGGSSKGVGSKVAGFFKKLFG